MKALSRTSQLVPQDHYLSPLSQTASTPTPQAQHKMSDGTEHDSPTPKDLQPLLLQIEQTCNNLREIVLGNTYQNAGTKDDEKELIPRMTPIRLSQIEGIWNSGFSSLTEMGSIKVTRWSLPASCADVMFQRRRWIRKALASSLKTHASNLERKIELNKNSSSNGGGVQESFNDLIDGVIEELKMDVSAVYQDAMAWVDQVTDMQRRADMRVFEVVNMVAALMTLIVVVLHYFYCLFM